MAASGEWGKNVWACGRMGGRESHWSLEKRAREAAFFALCASQATGACHANTLQGKCHDWPPQGYTTAAASHGKYLFCGCGRFLFLAAYGAVGVVHAFNKCAHEREYDYQQYDLSE